MKRITATLLCICLLLCNLAMMPEKYVQAKSLQLTSKSITVIKGQYAFVGLLSGVGSQKIKWSVAGGNIKLHKAGDESRNDYCYIKAVKTGTGTVKCTLGSKTFKCRVKVLDDAAFVGDFSDDRGEVYLDIFKSGKKYVAFYSQFRLAQMNWLTGTVKDGVLTLKGSDPAGKPITVTVAKKGAKRIFTFKKTSWTYFQQGDTMELEKCSGKKGFTALYGYGWDFTSYY